MLRSTRSQIICIALTFFTLVGGHAWAQSREAVQAKDDPRTDMPSLAEAAVVLEFANAQPEFHEALKAKNTEKVSDILLSYGLSEKVKVYDGPMETVVPGGPYWGCYTSLMPVYYPAPFSWPNHPRIVVVLICNNSAYGQTGTWD
ncbi:MULTISPECIES: hypothetical protein [unclassified Lysobacter]|uniref:hypothetical protein n=1 Tax=unclassified Lysobacter TaxID=2635362 RepID=UPI00070F3332|nr:MULTISPECIES: hypothetical protein [unclassified Lysobacter]KRD32155.1 hypothetical protein ASE35_14560 [Lysobacter sp. Root916]KRD76031.1 hypothetical protein ASE43_14570 [Lysobacter sp. Root983]